MRKKGGRVKKADGGAYTGMPGNYQPGFVQSAFGTGNLDHLRSAGMMASGDTAQQASNYLQGKFAYDPSGTQRSLQQKAPVNQQIENAYRYYLDRPVQSGEAADLSHQMAQGMDVAGLGRLMQNSPEYTRTRSLPQSGNLSPYQQSINYFAGPRSPGAMPSSMVPSLQMRNADQLAYQMSPEGQAADKAMSDQELAEKKAIIQANQEWQRAEDERVGKMAQLEAEQAAAKAREDAEYARQRARAEAEAQQTMLLIWALSQCDRRAKTNIVYIGKNDEGIKLYAFDYVDDIERCKLTGEMMPPKRIGPMAQDLEESFPERVMRIGNTLLILGTYELRPVTV